MALLLNAGREERMDGAPDPIVNLQEERVQAIIAHLMAKDTDGALFQGDPANARDLAVRLMMEEAWKHADEQKAAGRQAAEQASADRRAQRAAAQGVVPEDLPADEFGNVSGRTTQEANRPLDEQEAALLQEQDLADQQIRGLREGRRNWSAERSHQYAKDYGLGVRKSRTGKTDLDYIDKIQKRQGFMRLGTGEVIPLGRPPTPEDVERERKWDETVNKDPGSSFQAQYDPEAYEQYREGVRQDIQDRARADAVTYGVGADAGITEAQRGARMDRRDADDRRRHNPAYEEQRIARMAERAGVSMAEARAMVNSGYQRAGAEREMHPDSRHVVGSPNDSPPPAFDYFRDAYQDLRDKGRDARAADRAQRRAEAGMQARVAGGQPTVQSRAAVGQARFQQDRQDELLARLGAQNTNDWERVGLLTALAPNANTANPTPLGVDAMSAQNALSLMRNRMIGQQFGQDGLQPGTLNFEAALAREPLGVQAAVVRQQNGGVLPADSRVGMALLDDIEETVIGKGMGGNATVDLAVRKAVENGIPQADAEARFQHRRWRDAPRRGVPEGVAPNDPRAAGPAPPGWPMGRPWPPE
jgi:hypothetical protein